MTTELRRINKLYRDYYDKALIAFNRKDINEAEKLITQAIWIERTQPSFYALYAFIQLKKTIYLMQKNILSMLYLLIETINQL